MYELSKYYLKHTASYEPVFDSCGLLFSSKNWSHYANKTRDYEIIIVTEKAFYLTFVSESGKEDVIIRAGEILIIPPGQEFYATKPSAGIRFYWVHFRLPESAVLITEDEAAGSVSNYILPLHSDEFIPERELVLIQQLIEAKKSTKPLTELLNSYVKTLLLSLANSSRHMLKEKHTKISDKENNLQNFLKIYISHNFERLDSIDEVADYFGYNKIYLSQFFKEKYGVTIKQYIMNLRLEKAKDLLLATTLQINEIAKVCGYEDEKYFSRIFRKRYGVSPRDFRDNPGSIVLPELSSPQVSTPQNSIF